jgi:hypothetical protein
MNRLRVLLSYPERASKRIDHALVRCFGLQDAIHILLLLDKCHSPQLLHR